MKRINFHEFAINQALRKFQWESNSDPFRLTFFSQLTKNTSRFTIITESPE